MTHCTEWKKKSKQISSNVELVFSKKKKNGKPIPFSFHHSFICMDFQEKKILTQRKHFLSSVAKKWRFIEWEKKWNEMSGRWMTSNSILKKRRKKSIIRIIDLFVCLFVYSLFNDVHDGWKTNKKGNCLPEYHQETSSSSSSSLTWSHNSNQKAYWKYFSYFFFSTRMKKMKGTKIEWKKTD